jgi:hypothetical protein
LRVLQLEGFASPLMRYNGWELTSRVAQLHLFEGVKNALADSSTAAIPEEISPLTTVKAVEVVAPEGGKIALDSALMQELHSAGIGEPMASRLAVLPHVSSQYVRAHSLQAKADGISIGLLIHRIRSHDPAPGLSSHGHLKNCECDQCRRAKYICEEVIH